MSASSARRAKSRADFFNFQAPERTAFLAAPLAAWRRLMAVLIVIAFAHTFFARRQVLTERFFYAEDLALAGLMLLLLSSLYLVPASISRRLASRARWREATVMAVAVTVFGWAGAFLIYDNYALSTDEFLARFDARIFATGQLAARVPLSWQEFIPALQPEFMMHAAGQSFWVSSYLPVNAAFLALASKVGVMDLMPALWAGISVLAVFAIARRLWPERPMAAWIAAVLLATSPQLLITAMTPYAMSAHLALNLVWLWLVLRGGRLGHGAAAGVAFLATGLHQIIFHPLFAAPFVLEMWLGRRWAAALWHTAAFAVIGLFWMLYSSVLLHHLGASSIAVAASGDYGLIPRVLALLRMFDPWGVGLMAKNLVRFATWQSLLAVPLALTALIPAIRAGGVLRALALGILLTTAAMTVLLPYQGHGWGYRYLHGLMGSVCLMAAFAWTRLTREELYGDESWRRVFALAAAASLFVLLPLRAWQAHAAVHPYAIAERWIQSTDADVVIVDNLAIGLGTDLVRNDPFLERRPVVLSQGDLTPHQLSALCGRAAVRVFGIAEAKTAGLEQVPGRAPFACR